MRGHILGVDAGTGNGMVAGKDEERDAFRPADWAARGKPAIGLYVDVDAADDRTFSLFPAPGARPIQTRLRRCRRAGSARSRSRGRVGRSCGWRGSSTCVTFTLPP